MTSRQSCCTGFRAFIALTASLAAGAPGQLSGREKPGRVFPVANATDVDAALKEARPGDTLLMQDGTWRDADLRFRGSGTAGAPITLRVEPPGQVILTGKSRLSIVGRYLVVEGLLFKDDVPTAEKNSVVVSFRGDGKHSHHCRLTNCAIVDFSPPDKKKDTRWVSIYGTHNRVDHCHFANKTNLGTTVVVWLNDAEEHEPNHHRIDHNHFWGRPYLGMNGAETIRIGDSPRSMLDSRTVVEENYFYRCNGEGEIISNKSCENVYRGNTFVECEGALTLRHGNRCTVEGNFFLGNGAKRTGGVRVIGEDHRVLYNHFADLGGDDYRAALTMMEGIQDSKLSEYFQVKRALIAFNTFVNNRQTFNFGYATGNKGQVMPPVDCVVSDNLVSGGRAPLVTVHDPNMSLAFRGNVIYGAELGIPPEPGIRELDPKLAEGDDGIWRRTAESPTFNVGDGTKQEPGQPSRLRPLKPEDAGPNWLRPPF